LGCMLPKAVQGLQAPVTERLHSACVPTQQPVHSACAPTRGVIQLVSVQSRLPDAATHPHEAEARHLHAHDATDTRALQMKECRCKRCSCASVHVDSCVGTVCLRTQSRGSGSCARASSE